MSPRPGSTKTRRECFDANRWADDAGKIWLTCHLCGVAIDPARTPWEAEHWSPHANGGVDVLPAHVDCHKVKTARDLSEIAKGKRVRDRHFGITRSASVMPGSRRSRWRKKLNGEVVER